MVPKRLVFYWAQGEAQALTAQTLNPWELGGGEGINGQLSMVGF